jgi:hypothetical protein
MNCLKSKAAKFIAVLGEKPAVVYVFVVSEVYGVYPYGCTGPSK